MRCARGVTLIELMMVVAIIGIVAAIAIPLYADFQARSRIAKAQADLRALASAVSIFSAHMGQLPAALTDLEVEQVNPQGQKSGPFMRQVPPAPTGWVAYAGVFKADGTFTLTSNGDDTTVTVP